MPTRVPWVVEAVHVRFGSELPAICDWEAELWICVGEHNFPLDGPFWSSVVKILSPDSIPLRPLLESQDAESEGVAGGRIVSESASSESKDAMLTTGLAFADMKVADLRDELHERGASRTGVKGTLQLKLHTLIVYDALKAARTQAQQDGDLDAGGSEARGSSPSEEEADEEV